MTNFIKPNVIATGASAAAWKMAKIIFRFSFDFQNKIATDFKDGKLRAETYRRIQDSTTDEKSPSMQTYRNRSTSSNYFELFGFFSHFQYKSELS